MECCCWFREEMEEAEMPGLEELIMLFHQIRCPFSGTCVLNLQLQPTSPPASHDTINDPLPPLPGARAQH